MQRKFFIFFNPHLTPAVGVQKTSLKQSKLLIYFTGALVSMELCAGVYVWLFGCSTFGTGNSVVSFTVHLYFTRFLVHSVNLLFILNDYVLMKQLLFCHITVFLFYFLVFLPLFLLFASRHFRGRSTNRL